jgi:hypothetical protein
MTKRGKAEYTERAFKQDAAGAMKGDIVRGLIELITNADDAYGDNPGEIRVIVHPGDDQYAYRVQVSDSAKGLDYAGLEAAFTKLGAMTSELSQGGKSRGLFGRGAKDVAAFGAVCFEAIKEGKYSELTLYKTMEYSSDFQDEIAQTNNYHSMNVTPGKNGLSATISVKSGLSPLEFEGLASSLGNNAQLRDLVERRKVYLTDKRAVEKEIKLSNSLPTGEVVLERGLEIEGYPGESKIVLRKLQEFQSSNPSPTSAHGLLVKSGVSVFENTWFSNNLSKRAASGYLAGEVNVPQILAILKEELRAQIDDDEYPDKPLISRTRDGLEKEHPFFKALRAAVERAVLSTFSEIEEKSKPEQKQGDQLKKDFDLAAEAIGKDLAAVMKALEEDLPPDDEELGLSAFDVIPSVIVVNPNSKGVLTLRADQDLTSQLIEITAPRGGAGLKLLGKDFNNPYVGDWKAHQRLEGKYSDQLNFEVSSELGLHELQFKLGDEIRVVQIVIRRPEPNLVSAPQKLEWVPVRAFSAPGRGKNLRLRAPIGSADESVQISVTGVSYKSAPENAILRPTPQGNWVEATVHIKTSEEVGELHVKATLGNEAPVAVIQVEEATKGKGGVPKIEIELVETGYADERYRMVPTGVGSYKVIVFGNHPSYAGVFGNYIDSKGFSNENSIESRSVLAQVIAQAFGQYLVELDYEKHAEDKWDASSVIVRFREYSEKFVGKLHKALVRLEE